MIPPIFACAAALVHYQFHVPRSGMIPRAKDEKAKTKPRPPQKPVAPKRGAWQPREQAELDALRVRWEPLPLADEPDDADFRRQHDSLLRAVVQTVREAALEQRPTSLRVTPKCHTIRCSLSVCGPSAAVDAIAELLPKVERKDGPLWHELREVEPALANEPGQVNEPIKDDGVPEIERRSCREWVVGFAVDGSKRNDLQIDGYIKPEPKPRVDPAAATGADATGADPTKPPDPASPARDSTMPQQRGPGPT